MYKCNKKGVLAALFVSLTVCAAFAQGSDTFYISPNGDNVKDAMVIPLSVNDSRFIRSWAFIVTDPSGKEVYNKGETLPQVEIDPANWKAILAAFFKPKQSINVPKTIVWNGKSTDGAQLPDGTYLFYFSAADDNNNYGETRRYHIVVDTTPPSITVKQPTGAEKTFGQSAKPTLNIQQDGSREDLWTGEIKNEAGKTVRTFAWRDTKPPRLEWDGKDDTGVTLSDGNYSYSVSAVDAAGNKSAPVSVTAIVFDPTPKDAEAGRLAAELAPNGKTKTQTFTIKASEPGRIESWSFTVIPAGQSGGEPVASWPLRASEKIPSKIDWNGKLPNGSVAEGNFIGKLDIKYSSGTSVQTETAPFVAGIAPRLNVTTTPELFSPDGDGQNDALTINLDVKKQIPAASWSFAIFDPNNKPFWTTSGKSEIPQHLTWNGKGDDGVLVESAMDYPYTFTVTDTQEQTSVVQGKITIDVLILKDGNRLIIRVPAIIFRANNADFVPKSQDGKRGLTPEVIENNEKVLNRVAEILQRFRDYKVTVAGHANSETGTVKEEKEQLQPLSQARAEFVREYLIKQGVDGSRLKAEGLGGTKPVSADRKNRDSWWKNRRVEFVLER